MCSSRAPVWETRWRWNLRPWRRLARAAAAVTGRLLIGRLPLGVPGTRAGRSGSPERSTYFLEPDRYGSPELLERTLTLTLTLILTLTLTLTLTSSCRLCVGNTLAQTSASWRPRGLLQRQSVLQAARSFGQPRPLSRSGRAGWPATQARPCFRRGAAPSSLSSSRGGWPRCSARRARGARGRR